MRRPLNWIRRWRLSVPLVVAVLMEACAGPGSSAPDAGAEAPRQGKLPSASLPIPVDASVPAMGPDGVGMVPPDDDSPVHGSITARYISRDTDHAHDEDAYALVEASVNDPEEDGWNAYVSGRVARDLDGGLQDTSSPFHSIDDAHGDATHTHLYEAWIEGHATDFDLLRLGRQELFDTPEWVRFDGLQVETAPQGSWKQQFGFYGGLPARLDSEAGGDTLWGAWLKDRPWSGGRTRLDVMHLADEERLGAETNTLLAANVHQQFGADLAAEANYTLLDGASRDFDLRGTFVQAASGWTAQVNYHELLNAQNVLAEELDPFSSALLTYEPYWQASALLGKSFEAGFDLQAGWDTRRLKDASDAGAFNRDTERGFLTAVVHDVLVQGCAVSLTGERWSGDGSEMNTWGADLTQDWSRDVSTSVGSYFAMYKDDLLLGLEHQDVRTWYAKFKLRTDPKLTWTAGFDHEENEVGSYDTLTVRASWIF